MKKIIATVLAMVMALALCTTAFAVTYGKVYEFKDNKSWSEVDMTGKTISYTSASETKQDGKFVKGTIGYYTITNADSTKVYLAEVGANDATYRITVDGEVKNVKDFPDNTKISYTLKGSEVTFGGTVAKCGDVYKGTALGTATLYVDVDGDYYKYEASSSTRMLADGVVVPVVAATKGAAADYTVVAHSWETVASNLAADGYVTGTAKCTRCGQTANITSKKGDIPTGAKSEFLTLPMFGTTKTVWVYWTDGGNAGGSGSTSGAKPSPKTFDAGIALYAAMALTSVAGSAVVIGKKKEF